MVGGGIIQDGFSGGDRIVVECIKRWITKHEIHVFIGKAGYLSFKRYIVGGVRWHFTSSYTSRRNRLIDILLFSIQALMIGFLSAIRIDRPKRNAVIYSSDFLTDILPALLLKKRFSSLLVCAFYLFAPNPFRYRSFQGSQFMRAFLLWLAQKVSYALVRRYADIVFVTNLLDSYKFIGKGKFTGANVLVVEGGVDAKAPELVPSPPSKYFEAVFIGRLHPQKGVMLLVDIWKHVCDILPSAKLAIIGTGQLEASLRDRIRLSGLQNNISLLGFMDGLEKIHVFKESKVVLHPAIYESGGMAASEAMACGLPGVSFDLEVLRTYYPKGMLKTQCYDLKAFAQNIILLLSHERLYADLSRQALQLARERDWDKKAEEVLSFIEEKF